MMLGISYEKALEQARKDSFGKIMRFEFGPVKYLNYRDLKKDEITFDEAGMHTACGDVQLLFVNDKLVFSFLDMFRDKHRSRSAIMEMNYAVNILSSAVWCFQEGNFKDDENIDDEIKKTAEWLVGYVEFLRELVLKYALDFVAEGEHHWDLRNARKHLNVPRDIDYSILDILTTKTRGESDFE